MNNRRNGTRKFRPDDKDAALRCTENILTYSDNTEKKLIEKLNSRGFDEETVNYAVNYMKEHGFLDDCRYMARCAEYLADVRYYGRRRIASELIIKGFSPESVRENLPLLLENVDFLSHCTEMYKKVYKGDYQKAAASLMRYGYSWEEIKESAARYSADHKE